MKFFLKMSSNIVDTLNRKRVREWKENLPKMWQGISDMKAGQKAGSAYGKQKILKGASARYRKWLEKYAAMEKPASS